MIDKSVYGPWAVVAGGSEGVGAAFAHQLADAGINLVLIARKPGPLHETAERRAPGASRSAPSNSTCSTRRPRPRSVPSPTVWRSAC